jgi:16S rRNA (cytidine1402-2'-O)-methyltransferase
LHKYHTFTQKQEVLSSTLYLIPTPVAENAAETLPLYVTEIVRRLDVFIVERAKTARHFVKSAGPLKPLQEMIFVEIESRDFPDEAARVFREAVEAGKDIGLMSEAGCPGVADPGASIVSLAHQAGVRVRPLVGPSSILLALIASGMNGQHFSFHGYLSPKRPELARDLRKLEGQAQQHGSTHLFIETPYRSQMVLEVALESLHPETLFGVAQDITGQSEMIRSLPVREWKKIKALTLEKLPAMFMVGKAAPTKKG